MVENKLCVGLHRMTADTSSMADSASVTREQLCELVGFKIGDLQLYRSAFCHKSAVTCEPHKSYERLELLGDKVIDMVVTKLLFDMYPSKCEGFLTKMRTKLVSGQSLSRFARHLGLHRYIMMNDKALARGWNHNERILEDVFEALVGCIYLDCGLVTAREFLLKVIYMFVNFDDLLIENNYKDLAMRTTQSMYKCLPVYQYSEVVCPQTFTKLFAVYCYVNNVPLGYGCHRNKKQAEQFAAREALIALGVDVMTQQI